MSNFNEYFKKKGLKTLTERVMNGIDIYNPNVKVTSYDYSIVEELPQPASYYIENGLTASFKVRIEYTLNDSDEVRVTEYEVPKEVDGAFIIEGAYRIATNKLGIDYDCRIKMSGTGDHIINFDYDRQYQIDKRVLKVRRNNPELGLAQRQLSIKLEDIDYQTGENKELLKLTEKQSKKLQIKLDLDYKPEYITERLINDCLAFGDDRLKDLIIDKSIESVPSGFMRYIFKPTNFYSAKRGLTFYFSKYGRIQEQLSTITNLCLRYFKGSSDNKGDSGLQVPPGVNSMNLEAISQKITIPPSVAYNSTFSDLIDIADTPINNNTNLQNSLTVSCHITDEEVLFDVYDKEFTKITIPYIDYLNHKVCASEFVDYDTNTLKPGKDGMVEVKYRMGRRMVPVGEVELIDLHPDYRLSETTRRIPFINSTDSVRISMGTSMLKQSIPLVNAQRPLVDTGRDEELSNNILNEKFKFSEGTVKEITEDKVVIELPDKSTVDVLRRTAIQSINDVAVFTEPKVKVGQKVKEGDIITGAVGHEKDTYRMGLNTLVLFHAYYGLVNEDALVISESYANRLASYSVIDLMVNINNVSAIKWIAPIGTKVTSGDSVVGIYKAIRLDAINQALNEKLGGLFGDERDLSDYTVEDTLKVPNNIDEAWVSDVLVQKMEKPRIPKEVKAPDYKFTITTSEETLEEYNKTKSRKPIYDRFPEYVASDTLDPINMDPTDYKIVYTVRVRLIKRTIGMVGSKITSRYGGKGVVSTVKPDDKMPIMVDKFGKKHRVEVVMNPYSTINRKIAGVLLECSLGQIAHRISDLVEEYKKTKTGQKKIMPMIEKYYPRYKGMTTEEFLELHNTKPLEEVYYFNVGCFSDKFTPDLVNSWMEDLGLETQTEILMPEDELTDLDELKSNLSEEEYQKVVSDMSGKFIKVEKNLQCGWMVLEQLYHIPSYSNKVTSSMFGVDINSKKNEPILGKGRYRQTGQVIGEMELSVLLSRNASQFIKATRKDNAREDNQIFLNNLLGLGLTVVDDKGFNQGGSSLKRELSDLKAKFRRKNNIGLGGM